MLVGALKLQAGVHHAEKRSAKPPVETKKRRNVGGTFFGAVVVEPEVIPSALCATR